MYFPQENQGSVWTQYQSENIDTVRQTTCFLAATTLANDASYATRALPDGTLVHAAARQWEAFVSEWLKERALNGLFVELASTGYWARTWPCLFNLHDLPPPTSQVWLSNQDTFVHITSGTWCVHPDVWTKTQWYHRSIDCQWLAWF